MKENKRRLELREGGRGKPRRSTLEFLETEIWPLLPPEELDRPPMSKEEEEKLLGYDEEDER